MKKILKKIILSVQLVIIKMIIKSQFYDEIEFFSKASEAPKNDMFAERSLYRSIVHQLDKKILNDDNKDKLIGIVKNKIANAKNINEDLLEWGKKVLLISEKKVCNLETNGINLAKNAALDYIIKHRRSIRSFKSDALPEHFLKEIIDCALWAPTGCNRQNICFLPVTKTEDIFYCQKCAGEPGNFVKNIPLGIVVLADCRTYAFPAHRHQAYLEAGAAIQNMLLKATSLNIGSIWLNWAASGNKNKKFLNKFNLEKYLLPLSFVIFGYIDKPCFITPIRKSVNEAILLPSPNL